MTQTVQPGTGEAKPATTDPNNPTPSPAAAAAPIDVEAIRQAAKAETEAALLQQFKATTGFDNFDAFKNDKLKTDGKLQELADKHAAEAQTYKTRYQQSAVGTALLAASGEAVDPSVISQLLAGRAVCDDNGHVTIDGKPVADAVKALLADKPFLARAQGGTGSGTGQNLGGGKVMARAEFEKLPPDARSAFMRDGGQLS